LVDFESEEKCKEIGKEESLKRPRNSMKLLTVRKEMLLNDLNSCKARENLKKEADLF